jgi:hypothetical protein
VLPNFLVIGAPRSGTTWIDKNLREHPEVFMPREKELHFFDRHFERGLAWYESRFEDWRGEKAVGEATPDYMHGQYTERDLPTLIHAHLPQAKLIASLRNPVDRAYSRYWNTRAKHARNRNVSFEEKLSERPEFIREGFYAEHLERFLALYPRDRLMVLLYDDLVADGRAFMRRIYEFVGVDPQFRAAVEGVTVNRAAGKKFLAHSRALWLASRGLGFLGIHRLAERLHTANSVKLPPMDPGTRRQLHEIYRPHNARLERLIGRDLSHWERSEQPGSPSHQPSAGELRDGQSVSSEESTRARSSGSFS